MLTFFLTCLLRSDWVPVILSETLSVLPGPGLDKNNVTLERSRTKLLAQMPRNTAAFMLVTESKLVSERNQHSMGAREIRWSSRHPGH